MSENEWQGDVHTLVVHSVRLPDGPLDDGDLEYELQHPSTCKEEERDWGGVKVKEWACDVTDHDDLAFSLRYSGTPITKPGTYRIQGWGNKSWTELGYEYDAGVAVIETETGAA